MQTITFSTFKKLGRTDGLKMVSEKAINNIKTSRKIMEYCNDELNISGYRMSSGIVPLIGYKEANFTWSDLPDYDYIVDQLNSLGEYSRSCKLRVSFHPGEYTTMTSDNVNSIESSISDLNTHGQIFDMMGLPQTPEAPINFHIRKDGDINQLGLIARQNISRLPISVKNRVVLEVNDNVNGVWTVENLKKQFYETIGIPITFDSLHCSLLTGSKTLEENYNIARSTWGSVVPVFHFSVGKNGTRSHADFNEGIIPPCYGKHEIMWDVELKRKCEAIKLLISDIDNQT
jgi:UV DNA damage endonuclease